MLSQGTPMMLMGDEYGHTKGGNNNTYGLDGTPLGRSAYIVAALRRFRAGPLNDFQWGKLEKARPDLYRFFAAATRFRRDHPLLGRDRFLGKGDVTWHETNWDDSESKFLAWTLHADGGEGSLYAAFNAHHFALTDVPLPKPPAGCYWSRVADTNLPPPRDFDASADAPLSASYTFAPYSAVLVRAVRGVSGSKL